MKTRRCDSLRGRCFHGFPSQETYRTKFRYVLRGIGENDGIKPSGLFPSPLNFALNPLFLKIILVFFAAKNIENTISRSLFALKPKGNTQFVIWSTFLWWLSQVDCAMGASLLAVVAGACGISTCTGS